MAASSIKVEGSVRPLAASDHESLLRLDLTATGHDRSIAYQALLPVSRGQVLVRNDEIVAFSLCRPFGRGHVIDPIVAASEDDAIAVSRAHVEAHAGSFLRADTPASNTVFTNFLVGCGMQIHDSATSAKTFTQEIRSHRIPSMGEVVPPLLLHLGARAAWSADIGRRMPVLQNLLVSNVAGPPIPLYLCGAKVSGIYASSVLAGNQGLNVTLMSYEDRVDFGITADPDLVDDPWEFADGITDALVELMDAAGLGKPTPVYDAFAR